MNVKRVALVTVGAVVLSVGAVGNAFGGKTKPGGKGGNPNGANGGFSFTPNSGHASGQSGSGTTGGGGGGSLD